MIVERPYRFLLMLIIIVMVTGCDYSGRLDEDDSQVWYFLIHPSDAPDGSKIVEYNHTQNEIINEIDLPEGMSSPHALAYDGEHLWLGGMGNNEKLYCLETESGNVVQQYENIRTEGITVFGGSIWFSSSNLRRNVWLININSDGDTLQEIDTELIVIQDIAHFQDKIYYTYNDTNEPVGIIDLDTGDIEGFITDAALGQYVYAMSVHEGYLYIIDSRGEVNYLRAFDAETGEFLQEAATSIDGWITAMAPSY